MSRLGRRTGPVVGVVVALIVCACQATTSPVPGSIGPQGSQPAPSGGPDSTPAAALPSSSQGLIAADLAAGTIDLGTSLAYRAFALFWDPRLPERYDGGGSAGEDLSLFDDIRDALPSLPAEQVAVLRPFLVRPSDPTSAWSAPAAANDGVRLAAFAAEAPADRCVAPRQWFSEGWSPDGNVDHGVEAWICAASAATASPDLAPALQIMQKLWPAMTAQAPGGLGPPVPDTTGAAHEDNGKIDMYLLDPIVPCRQRGDSCEDIPGDAVAAFMREDVCGVPGYPANGCSGFLMLGKDRLRGPDAPADIAHEFFHGLQYAHTGKKLRGSWYMDATATWAEWEYVARSGNFSQAERDATKDNLWSLFEGFQDRTNSLLRVAGEGSEGLWEYEAWAWPMFQTVKAGEGSVPDTWQALDAATDLPSGDRIIDGALSFKDFFQEFSVWNAQPADYIYGKSEGLDDVSWQSKTNLGSLPRKPHKLKEAGVEVKVGEATHGVNLEQLATQYDVYRVTDETVRQITIDISSLKNAGTADLDVLGQLEPKDGSTEDKWRRVADDANKITFCRDDENDRVAIFEVVLANHAFTSLAGGVLPQDDRVTGSYQMKAKDKCEVPIGFDVEFKGADSRGNDWHGHAHFEQLKAGDPLSECEVTAQVVQYCYAFISGDATWTHAAVGQGEDKTCAGSGSGSISPSTGDGGMLMLTILDEEEPDRAKTYEGFIQVGAASTVIINGQCTPQGQVITWASFHGTPRPTITAGYHLSGQARIDSQFGYQQWQWSMVPIFPDE